MRVTLSDVVRAIDEDAVIPCFQPLTDLQTGQTTGFEVLARWQHPEQGLILPANFISLAEENGLIGALSEQVFRKAFRLGARLPSGSFLAVNVSPIQLRDPQLARQLRGWSEECGFPLNRVTVEITESALLENLELARTIAVELKDLGCSLALDDFGTGYSSLLHLQALPFDELKIDRSFVKNIVSARESRKIVAGVIGLAHSLDLVTVAEGIETEEQAEMLLAFGCQLGQGWFYGRPVTADAALAGLSVSPRAISIQPAASETVLARTLEGHPAERLAQLQAIYDGAPVGLCFLDRKLRYVSINRRLAEMNRVPVAAHLGRTVREVHEDNYENFEPHLLRALAGEAIHGVEVVRGPSRTGGAAEYNLASYQPAWDEAGEVIGLSIAVVDITALKVAEEALRQRDDLYRHLFEIDPHVPWITDARGQSLQVNSQWSRATGWSSSPATDGDWLENVHPDDAESAKKRFLEAMGTGCSIDMEYRAADAKGGWRWMRSRGSPHFSPEGKITHWYGVVEDIDDRKQIDQALEFVQARLRSLFSTMLPLSGSKS